MLFLKVCRVMVEHPRASQSRKPLSLVCLKRQEIEWFRHTEGLTALGKDVQSEHLKVVSFSTGPQPPTNTLQNEVCKILSEPWRKLENKCPDLSLCLTLLSLDVALIDQNSPHSEDMGLD